MPVKKMNSRSSAINSCSLDKADLVSLFNLLEVKVREALAFEIAFMESTPNILPEQVLQIKQRISDNFKLAVSIVGSNGELLMGDDTTIFNDRSFPANISKVVFDSSFYFKQVIGQDPMNKLTVQLDFSSQKILDFSNLSTEPNPNQSNISVIGINDTWVTGVYAEIVAFFNSKKKNRSWLHKKYSYDLFLYLLFYPIVFWTIFRVSEHFKNQMPIVLIVAICLYLFFAVLSLMRLLFNYSRWIFPLVEFSPSSPRRKANRAVLTFIILAIISTFISDLYQGIRSYVTK